jgi:hypothetical protein
VARRATAAGENLIKTHLDWLTIGEKERGIQLLRSLGGRLYAELDRQIDV